MTPARLAPALFVAIALAACASPSTPRPAVNAINVTLAAQRSAELDAAQTFQETTVGDAGEALNAGTITAEEFDRVDKAAGKLLAALRIAHAEQKLYQVAGSNRDDYDKAFAAVKAARTDLELIWEAVQR